MPKERGAGDYRSLGDLPRRAVWLQSTSQNDEGQPFNHEE